MLATTGTCVVLALTGDVHTIFAQQASEPELTSAVVASDRIARLQTRAAVGTLDPIADARLVS